MVQDNVADTCSMYYDRFRRQTHVTPKSYLSFLEGYKVLYNEKHDSIAEMARRYEGIDGIILVNNPDNFFIEWHLNFVNTRLSGDISQPTIINSSLVFPVEICKKLYTNYNVIPCM